MRLSYALFILGIFFLTSCRYHFQDPDHLYEDRTPITINVPYIKGDKEGELNTAVALALAESGSFEYRQNDATLELNLAVLSDEGSVIGYRYDRNPNTGALRPNVLSTENRRTITISVKLIDTKTDKVLLGPTTISACGDFDYVETSSIKDLTFSPTFGPPQTVINFSMGQLDAIDGANDAARRPIYKELAQKIVQAVMNAYP